MEIETSPPPSAERPSAAPPPAYSHRQILRVLSGVLLCILLAALDQTVVVPAVPAIAADLHGFNHLAWIVTAYLLTSTAATPVYGRLSDIYGRRAMLLPALVLFMLASALCALSPNPRRPDRRARACRAWAAPGWSRWRRWRSPTWWRRASAAATRPTCPAPGASPRSPGRSSAAI